MLKFVITLMVVYTMSWQYSHSHLMVIVLACEYIPSAHVYMHSARSGLRESLIELPVKCVLNISANVLEIVQNVSREPILKIVVKVMYCLLS